VELTKQRRSESKWTTHVVSVRRDFDRTEAKRKGRELAASVGLGPDRAAALDIVIHELSSNLLDHAVRGELWLRTIAGRSVEVAAIDAGPGIKGLGQILRRRTAVTGLPNVRRLSQQFHAESRPGGGTYVRAVIGPTKTPTLS